MRVLKHRWRSFGAVLAALALLAPAAPEALALWGDHDHSHVWDAGAGGWVHDHARHDSQLEPADPVPRAECALCAGRSRTDVPLLLAPASSTSIDTGTALALAAPHPVSIRALRSGQPRAPPVL